LLPKGRVDATILTRKAVATVDAWCVFKFSEVRLLLEVLGREDAAVFSEGNTHFLLSAFGR